MLKEARFTLNRDDYLTASKHFKPDLGVHTKRHADELGLRADVKHSVLPVFPQSVSDWVTDKGIRINGYSLVTFEFHDSDGAAFCGSVIVKGIKRRVAENINRNESRAFAVSGTLNTANTVDTGGEVFIPFKGTLDAIPMARGEAA